jgi:AcrR family transcriptional regulator
MPADASATREKLIVAAEGLFATDGIEAAQLRDIVRTAGQANDSAVHYHFGSRFGLLVAICERHIEAMEPERRELLDGLRERGADHDLPELVRALVLPTVRKLETPSGRSFLRIMVQLAGRVGLHTGGTPEPVLGTALFEELTLLRETCAESMPAAIAVERLEAMIFLFTAALAERARQIDGNERVALDHDTFTANLISMWIGALGAPWPPPGETLTTRRSNRATAD